MLVLVYCLVYVIGAFRTGNQLFLSFFEIKEEYKNFNIGLLWVIMYISSPLSDLISTLQFQNEFQYGISILNDVTPAFLTFDPAIANPKINFIDGPKTYITPFYEDFGWFGVVMTNFFISIICFLFYNDSFFKKNFLIVSLMYTSLIFIFFTNYFFFFSTIIQFLLSIFIYKYIQCKSI